MSDHNQTQYLNDATMNTYQFEKNRLTDQNSTIPSLTIQNIYREMPLTTYLKVSNAINDVPIQATSNEASDLPDSSPILSSVISIIRSSNLFNPMPPKQTNNIQAFPPAHEGCTSSVSQYPSLNMASSSSIGSESNEDDASKRLSRSRERNREHARRTRMRKKAQMQTLQARVKILHEERQNLKQRINECSIATILLGLSSNSTNSSILETSSTLSLSGIGGGEEDDCTKVAFLADGTKRNKRMFIDAVLNHKKPGSDVKVGEHNEITSFAFQPSTCQHQSAETLRRERNRMHAKMTRDRKKCFISAIEHTIRDLENDIKSMQNVLSKVIHLDPSNKVLSSSSETEEFLTDSLEMTQSLSKVTPVSSPEFSREVDEFDSQADQDEYHPSKRACHGFHVAQCT